MKLFSLVEDCEFFLKGKIIIECVSKSTPCARLSYINVAFGVDLSFGKNIFVDSISWCAEIGNKADQDK